MPPAGYAASHRERVRAALELHATGLDARSIADRLGTTVERATRWLSEGLRGIPAQDVDDLRTGVEVRLDRLAAVYGALLDSDDERTRLAAANGLRQVEADRVRALGLMQRPRED